MSTFLAFRTAVISTLKQHRVPPVLSRPISASLQSFANDAVAKTPTKFNKNAFLLAHAEKAEEPKQRKKNNGPLKNEKIHYRNVQINHNGRLSAPTTVRRILSLLDRRGYYIQLISHQPPIVRIVNQEEEYKRKKEEHERAKLLKAKREHKEIQLSWVTSGADAVHKLEKARKDLAKGFRVELVFAHKSNQPLPSVKDMHKTLQRTADSLADVGKEWKERVLQRKMGALFLKGAEPPNSEPEQVEIETDVPEVVKKDGKNQRRLTRKEKILQSELGGGDGADASTLRKRECREIPQEIWDLFQ
jgi:translation initiation factor IF-3